MAKGNIILGYLRGSIGDITFFRAKGQQLSRARNRAPANPKTAKQVTQRAKWAAASKFFTQVGADFFKYAYEDKKTNESYFNVFMRKNVSYGGLIGAKASKIFDWPSFGLWQIADGKLPELTAPFPQDVNGVLFDVGATATTGIFDVAGLSSALINANSNVWRNGDILTLLCYVATPYLGLPTVDTTTSYRAYPALWQIILDTNSIDDLPELTVMTSAGNLTFNAGLGSAGLSFVTTDDIYANCRIMWGLVHSRVTSKGLQVSPSTMVCPQDSEFPLLFTELNSGYYSDVLSDWQAAEEAILQGGLGAAAEVVAEVVGWSDSTSGPFNKVPDDVTLFNAEPVTATIYVKYSSAAAAAAGVSLINGIGANGGTITLTKTVNGDLVTVSYTATLTQASSTAQVRVGTEVAVGIRRTE